MIFILELGILLISLLIVWVQRLAHKNSSIVTNKVTYWTALLFVSICYNIILFSQYPHYYSIGAYANTNIFLFIFFAFLSYVLILLLSPSSKLREKLNHLILLLKKEKKKKNMSSSIKEWTKKEQYIKELQFEMLVEFICWSGIVFSMAIELAYTFLSNGSIDIAILNAIVNIICVLVMFSITICIRQILFYLKQVEPPKDKELSTKLNLQFYDSLKSNNKKL